MMPRSTSASAQVPDDAGEQGRISVASHPTCAAVSEHIRRASRSPCLPVHALALPAFTTMPRSFPRSRLLAADFHRRGEDLVGREHRRRRRELRGVADQQADVVLLRRFNSGMNRAGDESLG